MRRRQICINLIVEWINASPFDPADLFVGRREGTDKERVVSYRMTLVFGRGWIQILKFSPIAYPLIIRIGRYVSRYTDRRNVSFHFLPGHSFNLIRINKRMRRRVDGNLKYLLFPSKRDYTWLFARFWARFFNVLDIPSLRKKEKKIYLTRRMILFPSKIFVVN